VRSGVYLYAGTGALLLTASLVVIATEGGVTRLAQSLLH
jgi:hypothetical protein